MVLLVTRSQLAHSSGDIYTYTYQVHRAIPSTCKELLTTSLKNALNVCIPTGQGLDGTLGTSI